MYLAHLGTIQFDPSLKLVPPAREHYQPRVLAEAEYKSLQLACAHDIRDAALIELLLQTGLRLSEVAALHIHDLQLPARPSRESAPGAVLVHGKGRKERTVTLNRKACKAIKAWLAVRPAVPDDQVFATRFRQPLGPRGIRHLVHKYLSEAGIRGVSVHSLRHTFATQMIRRGTHVSVVQKALGHEFA